MIAVRVSATNQEVTDTLMQEGVVVDLTGANVEFVLRGPTLQPIYLSATISSTPTDGQVSYTLKASDIPYEGKYYFEWKVRLPGGDVITLPESGPRPMRVLAVLG